MFLAILIGNTLTLKQLKQFLKFCRLTQHFTHDSYIIFCYNLKITFELKQILRTHPNIHLQWVKKDKINTYLTFFFPYLHNSILFISCSDLIEFIKIVKLVSNTILFLKLNNNIYSLNSIDPILCNRSNLILILNSITYQYLTVLTQLSLK